MTPPALMYMSGMMRQFLSCGVSEPMVKTEKLQASKICTTFSQLDFFAKIKFSVETQDSEGYLCRVDNLGTEIEKTNRNRDRPGESCRLPG